MIYLSLMRMRKNKMLMLSLLIGILLAVTAACMIPTYSSALTQRMLTASLKTQQEEGNHPGEYTFSLPFSTIVKEDFTENYSSIVSSVDTLFISKLPMSCLSYSQKLSSKELICEREDIQKVSQTKMRLVSYSPFTSFSLLYGAMPQPRTDGIIEAVITKNAEIANDITVGKEYFCHLNQQQEGVYVLVTGVIEPETEGYTDIYDPQNLNGVFLCSYKDMSMFLLPNGLIEECGFHAVFDYSTLTIDQMPMVTQINREGQKWLTFNSASADIPNADLFESFTEKKNTVETLLILFELPLLCMIAIYLILISGMVIENDKNEIALLLSRGATKQKILGGYFVQSGILAISSLIAAIPLSLFIVSFLGNISGFMEFESRQGLEEKFSFISLFYALGAAVFSMTAMLLPCFPLLKTNTVKAKQRKRTKPIWKKLYLDVLCLVIAFYGYFSYTRRQSSFLAIGGDSTAMPIDPIVFFMLFLFAIGSGLLFLRLYQPLLKFIFRLTGKKLSPAAYSGMMQAANGENKQQALMLFLILTLILSIFCANSARSMNTNILDRICYSGGADIVADIDWNTSTLEDASVTEKDELSKPFLLNNIEGVSVASRIITGYKPKVNDTEIKLMGIDTKEFSAVAWTRGDLNETHMNAYLNLLGSEPMACIISQSLAEALSLQKGDSLILTPTASNRQTVTLLVYEIIEYWPTFNSHTDKPLLIANRAYLDYMLPNLDFDAWLSLEENADTETVLTQLRSVDYTFNDIFIRSDAIDNANYEPSRQATNGILTFSFLAECIIAFCGFILFWILQLKKRTLQLATLHAMGMTEKESLSMLGIEQMLSGFISIAVAIVLAYYASKLFVPVTAVAFSAQMQVPPLRVVFDNTDYLKIYGFIMLLYCVLAAITLPFVHRLQPAQAIKLSEE